MDESTNELREATDKVVQAAADAAAEAKKDGSPVDSGTLLAGDARHGRPVIFNDPATPDEARVEMVDDPPVIIQGGEATEAPELADAGE